MKNAWTLIVALIIAQVTVAQTTENFVIPLSNPGERGMLEVGLINGDILVTSYDGQEVMVTATIEDGNMVNSRNHEHERDENNTPPPGMKRISGSSVEIGAEEEDNVVEIHTESWKKPTNLNIKVPENFDLELHTVHGIIQISNISGKMDISNVNGSILMDQISGSVLANTVNGEVKVNFIEVDTEPMSFATLNGDVDITLPANTKATALLKTDRGEIYTDFDMPTESAREETKETDDKYSVRINAYIKGKINGGGSEFTFKSMTGDIIIRKGK
jgi:DUF4097 and DUF4098 domain-containing protein YvlB